MPSIKLVYFDTHGRAEPSRLALTIGGVAFEDRRVPFKEWAGLKHAAPYGSLPYMELDGKLVSGQSRAILQYCGTVARLYPAADPLACLKVNDAIDALDDATLCLFRYMGNDKAKLLEERTKFVEEDIPRYYGGLDMMLAKDGDGPWAVGDTMTIADVAIYAQVAALRSGVLDHVPTDIGSAYPRIMASYSAVLKHPKVVAWAKEHTPVPAGELE